MVIRKFQFETFQFSLTESYSQQWLRTWKAQKGRLQLVCRWFSSIQWLFYHPKKHRIFSKRIEHWKRDVQDTGKQSNTDCYKVLNSRCFGNESSRKVIRQLDKFRKINFLRERLWWPFQKKTGLRYVAKRANVILLRNLTFLKSLFSQKSFMQSLT